MKNNEVQIKGKIVYMYETENKGNILLKVGCRGNVADCFVCDEDLKRHMKNYSIGDYINLTGNIQSSKRGDKLSCVVFVESIIPPEYVDKSFYNQFWISGTIVDICELKNCWRFIIKTQNDRWWSYVPVVFYFPDERKMNGFLVGMPIVTQGSIQSVRKKNSAGEYVYYQNYVGNISKTG